MLTKECKIILKKLKQLTSNTEEDISYLYNTTSFCLLMDDDKICDYHPYENEIDSILQHLYKEGYLTFTTNDYNFKLTQKALHHHQFIFSSLQTYAADKAIDFAALIISIIALLKSYGYDVLAPIIALCKSLLVLLWK